MMESSSIDFVIIQWKSFIVKNRLRNNIAAEKNTVTINMKKYFALNFSIE